MPGSAGRAAARRRAVVAGFAAAVALFAASGVLLMRQDQNAASAAAQVDHTLQVLSETLELDAQVLLMEGAHRAWLVRGEPRFLAERDARRDEAAMRLAELRRATRDNPAQQARLAELDRLLERRHARMRATVARAAKDGLDAGRSAFRSEGEGSLIPLRAALRAVRADEEALLSARRAEADARAERLRWLMLGMPAAGLVVLLFAFRALLSQLDRTAKVHAELADAESVQRAMFDSAGYMIVGTDADGTVRLFNRAAGERTGWGPDDVVGKVPMTTLHEPGELAERADDLSAELGRSVTPFDALVARVLDGGIDEREWTWTDRAGRRFPVQLAMSALRSDDGALRGFIAVAQDITRRRAAEREIRGLNDALQSSVQELESFSYSVSHDLRAPLRHIDGYARMLAEDLGPTLGDEPRRFLDQIGASSRRMGALIDDLLALARLGRKPLAVAEVDMTQLAADAWREVMEDSRASARFILEPLPPVAGDASLLRQTWLNLLSNAVKYSAPRGADALVEISASRAPESVTYHVRDNGVGFDPRYADKLFGVFQRLHAQDEFEGTGVGLAIVHRIVRRHGGNVWAESEAGLGACFSFELPDRDDE